MEQNSKVTQQDAQTMQTSKDGRELQNAAVVYAQEQLPQSISFLEGYMKQTEFLERLDTKDAYQGTFNRLRLARVMKNLMENRIEPVDQLLLSLTDAPPYQSNALRVQLEIRALAVIKPSPPKAIDYWNKYSAPDGPLAYDVIEALCENQSEPAMALLEKKFNDPGHDRYEKQSWLREIILPRRNDYALILVLEKLVMTSTDINFQIDILEALFDYIPDSWYIECEPPVPPARKQAIKPVKDTLVRIGNHGLGLKKVPDPLKRKIEAGLDEIKDNDSSTS